MNFIICVLSLLLAIRSTQAHTEVVWLEDTNDDHDKRNLDMGLPSQLEFNLKRENGQQMKLQLQESARMNPYAPVFTTVLEYGVQKAIRIETKPIIGTKFYHDKKALAAVMVSCKIQDYGPCKRFVEGSLHIEGEGYEIKPSPTLLAVRSVGANSDVPHIIEKVYSQQKKGPIAKGEHVQGEAETDVPEQNNKVESEEQTIFEDLISRLKSVLLEDALEDVDKDIEEGGTSSEDDHEDDHDKTYPSTIIIETRNKESNPADLRNEAPYTDYMIPPDYPPFIDLGSDLKRRNIDEAKMTILDPADDSEEVPYTDYMIPPDYPPFFDLESDLKRRNIDEAKKTILDPADDSEEVPYTDYMIPPDYPPFFDLVSDLKRRNIDEAKKTILYPADGSQEEPYTDYMIPPDYPPFFNLESDWKQQNVEETKKSTGDRATYTSKRVPPKPKVSSSRGPSSSLEEGEDISDGHSSGRHERSMQKRTDDINVNIEVLMIIDPALWKKYYERTSANNGMDKDEATMHALRERLVHVINGANLRYATIEDPEVRLFIGICGFLFYKTIDSSNPLKTSISVTVSGDEELVDKSLYLESFASWSYAMKNVNSVPDRDHEMLITGYELYAGSVGNIGVEGVAYLGGTCGWYKQSLIEDDHSYFVLTGIVTHELGHNLGSHHDGSDKAKACPASDKFVMTPTLPQFGRNTPYSVNPWRFSTCSVEQMKTFFKSRQAHCIRDTATIYDQDEWDLYSSQQPGELYTPAEQCTMLMGKTSYPCESVTNEIICRTMSCHRNGFCYYYSAARGTPCGEPNLNKSCVDGLCVERNVQETTPQTTTKPTTTSQASTVKSATMRKCVDEGWRNWNCQRISKYFLAVHSYQPIEWCQDSYWQHACCKLCKAVTEADRLTVTTTSALPTTTDVCEDSNYYSWSCARVSEYFAETFKLPPKKWCLDPDWNEKCCIYCKNNSA